MRIDSALYRKLYMNDFYDILKERFGILPPTKYEQDWQWTCGKSYQTDGYISFYHEYSNSMTDDQKYLVINIIIQGFEDILSESDSEEEKNDLIWNEIEQILVNESSLHKETIKYWADLEVSLADAWYISKYMRKLVKSLCFE